MFDAIDCMSLTTRDIYFELARPRHLSETNNGWGGPFIRIFASPELHSVNTGVMDQTQRRWPVSLIKRAYPSRPKITLQYGYKLYYNHGFPLDVLCNFMYCPQRHYKSDKPRRSSHYEWFYSRSPTAKMEWTNLSNPIRNNLRSAIRNSCSQEGRMF